MAIEALERSTEKQQIQIGQVIDTRILPKHQTEVTSRDSAPGIIFRGMKRVSEPFAGVGESWKYIPEKNAYEPVEDKK